MFNCMYLVPPLYIMFTYTSIQWFSQAFATSYSDDILQYVYSANALISIGIINYNCLLGGGGRVIYKFLRY